MIGVSSIQLSIERELKNLVKTGRYYLGSRRSLEAVKRGEAKLLIIAENAPPEIRERALYYAKLSNTPVIVFKGSTTDLGLAVGKPFTVSMIAVLDEGTARLLDVRMLQG
ncbi:MAG: 50S ribosomal protein L30e [Acidilobaceae archaeon]